MNGPMPVVWIFMLLMVLIVFGALAAIIWRSWIVGGIVLTIFVLIFGLYCVRAVPVQTATPATVTNQGFSEQSDLSPEMLKNATVYPSLDQAAKNLTLRLLDQIDQNKPEKPPQHLHIVVVKTDRAAEMVKFV